MLRAAAAERNSGPIAEVLKHYLRDGLKVASGTGQHVAHFAPLFPGVTFQPTECDHRSIHSIVAYVDHLQLPNLRVPLFVDVSKPVTNWALTENFAPQQVDVVYSANMIHISSNAAVSGLFEAASVLLKPSTGLLITYGPYSWHGKITPESNRAFDESLRTQNPEWGLRDVDFLTKFVTSHDMPANNKILVFKRR